MKEIGIGLIGTGRHGVRYANHLVRGDIPGATLVAVQRRDHEAGRKQAGEWGAEYRTSTADLVGDERVGAVVVVSQSDHHVEAVCAALDAGKPVLVEKPLALDLEGCEKIKAKAESCKVPVMVGQTSRYEGPIRGMIEHLSLIGEVQQLSFVLRSEDRTHNEQGEYLPRLADGGAILDSGVHYFDLIPRLAGEVRVLCCDALHARGTELADGYAAIMRTERGVQVTITMGRWGSSRHEAIELSGMEGTLLVSRTPASLLLVKGREKRPLPFPEVQGTLVPTLLDYMRVCRGEIAPPITIDDGEAAVRIANACCQSGGNWVDLQVGPRLGNS